MRINIIEGYVHAIGAGSMNNPRLPSHGSPARRWRSRLDRRQEGASVFYWALNVESTVTGKSVSAKKLEHEMLKTSAPVPFWL